ncbi:hypothetical protein OAF63_03420 [Saprospiraceae bacterium]|jgi:hypothetical protein|nr:hypothetical protein [Bacteroidota bacterium]MDB4727818.1 hypothetical protein [Saprospiraceae bacterium]
MGSIIALAGVAIFAVFAISVLSKIFGNFSPRRGKVQNDLKKIKTELQPWLTDLVPFEEKDIELLSLNQIKNTSKKGIVKTAKGIFTSIYHEPMVAYGYKKYVASGTNALLYAKTTDHEFIYRINNDEVEIVIDDHLAGIMKKDGKFYGAKSNKLLAQVNQGSEDLLLPVIVKGKEIGSIVNPAKASKTNPRALEYVGNLDKDEETLFLSFAVLEMVQRNFK